MASRRKLLKSAAWLTGGLILGGGQIISPQDKTMKQKIQLMMPEEGEPHERTWMSFVANDYIWSKRQIPEVKRNLALIAQTIAQYEPVSLLVSPEDYEEAIHLLDGLNAHNYPIELIEFATDDLWLRDTGPTFVKGSDGAKYGINFNFNGWGNKQEHQQDARVADIITQKANSLSQTTDLVLEGGCVEVDGQGTAILTKSCVLNDNRNPHLSLTEVEQELKALLGLRKIIWLEGIKGQDITDGHTDFYARFSRPGQVIVSRDNYRKSFDYAVTRANIAALHNAIDADGNQLELIIIDTPDYFNEAFGTRDFAAGYIGYYVCNAAVIMQQFGDQNADARAREMLAEAFPHRTIEQIEIDGIASGGGSIHCATQQEPKV